MFMSTEFYKNIRNTTIWLVLLHLLFFYYFNLVINYNKLVPWAVIFIVILYFLFAITGKLKILVTFCKIVFFILLVSNSILISIIILKSAATYDTTVYVLNDLLVVDRHYYFDLLKDGAIRHCREKRYYFVSFAEIDEICKNTKRFEDVKLKLAELNKENGKELSFSDIVKDAVAKIDVSEVAVFLVQTTVLAMILFVVYTKVIS